MFEVLEAYFEKSFSLTKEDKLLIRSLFLPASFKKADFMLREGEVPKYGAFVCKGLMRSYVVDDKGKEHIIQFAPENWWISAKPDVSGKITSSVFIDSIENSEVLLIDRSCHATMMEKVPGYADMFHAGIRKRNDVKDQRIINALSATAEERYHNFLIDYPTIAQRVPQHMLASYLGITPETVSRIRRKAITKK